jgi:SET domain
MDIPTHTTPLSSEACTAVQNTLTGDQLREYNDDNRTELDEFDAYYYGVERNKTRTRNIINNLVEMYTELAHNLREKGLKRKHADIAKEIETFMNRKGMGTNIDRLIDGLSTESSDVRLHDRRYHEDRLRTMKIDGACIRSAAATANHHPTKPNAIFCRAIIDEQTQLSPVWLYAIRNIKQGEEIFVNYGENYERSALHTPYENIPLNDNIYRHFFQHEDSNEAILKKRGHVVGVAKDATVKRTRILDRNAAVGRDAGPPPTLRNAHTSMNTHVPPPTATTRNAAVGRDAGPPPTFRNAHTSMNTHVPPPTATTRNAAVGRDAGPPPTVRNAHTSMNTHVPPPTATTRNAAVGRDAGPPPTLRNAHTSMNTHVPPPTATTRNAAVGRDAGPPPTLRNAHTSMNTHGPPPTTTTRNAAVGRDAGPPPTFRNAHTSMNTHGPPPTTTRPIKPAAIYDAKVTASIELLPSIFHLSQLMGSNITNFTKFTTFANFANFANFSNFRNFVTNITAGTVEDFITRMKVIQINAIEKYAMRYPRPDDGIHCDIDKLDNLVSDVPDGLKKAIKLRLQRFHDHQRLKRFAIASYLSYLRERHDTDVRFMDITPLLRDGITDIEFVDLTDDVKSIASIMNPIIADAWKATRIAIVFVDIDQMYLLRFDSNSNPFVQRGVLEKMNELVLNVSQTNE